MSDYISREEAIKSVFGMVRETGIDETPYEYAEHVVTELPSADVKEVVHGEWIPKERPNTDFGLYIDIVCSECGYVGFESYAYGYEPNEIDMKKVRKDTKEFDMNFCPCCGCSMDKGDIWQKTS